MDGAPYWVVSDPAVVPAPGSGELVYATGRARGSFFGFEQGNAALLPRRAASPSAPRNAVPIAANSTCHTGS
ncbi:hypothetical protein GCM10022419_117730 [Nonomuraea rosea]|uniref:Uncharacterized protein n=1 Tax=Nonomuraea rosea TaxID=638574 RepID=A0ABP6ZM44_9ACTN